MILKGYFHWIYKLVYYITTKKGRLQITIMPLAITLSIEDKTFVLSSVFLYTENTDILRILRTKFYRGFFRTPSLSYDQANKKRGHLRPRFHRQTEGGYAA